MMAMPERDLDPRDVGVSVPRFVVSHRRAAIVVVCGYIGLVTFVALFLALLEVAQRYDDVRNWHATVIFAVVVAFPFGRALRTALRPPTLPSYPRRLTTR